MIIHLHHAEPRELRQRVRDVRDGFDGRPEIEIVSTPSRNELLMTISDSPPGSDAVALIDLRSETGDIEQSGLRIAKSISTNPHLCERVVAAIWTDHISNSNAIGAAASGARALISDAWVDEAPGNVLAGAIERVLSSKPGDFYAFPPRPTIDPWDGDPDDAVRAQAFERWFGFTPRAIHFHLLWGLANSVELEFLKEHLAEIEVAGTPSAAKGQLGRLQDNMRGDIEALDRPESGNAEIARRFLAEMIPPDLDPISELNWPRLSTIQEALLENDDAIRYSFVDDASLEMLRVFLRELTVPPGGSGRLRGSEMYKAIDDAVAKVARLTDTPEAVAFNSIHLAAHSIDDARWDLRRFGPPNAKGREHAVD